MFKWFNSFSELSLYHNDETINERHDTNNANSPWLQVNDKCLFFQWVVVCWLAHFKQSLWPKVFPQQNRFQRLVYFSRKLEAFLYPHLQVCAMFSMNSSNISIAQVLPQLLYVCRCYNQSKWKWLNVVIQRETVMFCVCLSCWAEWWFSLACVVW